MFQASGIILHTLQIVYFNLKKNVYYCWLDIMYQPRSYVYVTRISLGSIIYADVLIFGGPVIALGLIGKSLFAVKLELMKHTRRPSISLVSETSMFS